MQFAQKTGICFAAVYTNDWGPKDSRNNIAKVVYQDGALTVQLLATVKRRE